MRTMRLNFKPEEMEVVNQMAASKGVSKTAIMRKALKLYKLVDDHMTKGRRLRMTGDTAPGCIGDDE